MPKRLTKKAYRTRQEAFDKEFGGGKAARLIELGGAYTDAKAAKAFFSELDTSKPGEAEPPFSADTRFPAPHLVLDFTQEGPVIPEPSSLLLLSSGLLGLAGWRRRRV